MSYLAIDLGNKRCGLAYVNTGIVFPLPMVARVEIIHTLKKYVGEKNITTLVIGMPYDLYGGDHIQKERTEKFVLKLKKIFSNIQIETIDERFTTQESLHILQACNSKNIETQKDSISACLILESFIDNKKMII